MDYRKPYCAPGESDSTVMLGRILLVFLVICLFGGAFLFL